MLICLDSHQRVTEHKMLGDIVEGSGSLCQCRHTTFFWSVFQSPAYHCALYLLALTPHGLVCGRKIAGALCITPPPPPPPPPPNSKTRVYMYIIIIHHTFPSLCPYSHTLHTISVCLTHTQPCMQTPHCRYTFVHLHYILYHLYCVQE